MGKRNPVTLVSAVVKRNSAVVTGNLCEANIPPTTIQSTPYCDQGYNDMQNCESAERHP